MTFQLIVFMETESPSNTILKPEETTERLNFALEGSQDGLWEWDIENYTHYQSDRYKELIQH